ncbi:MAG: divalent-cation tolerance protein CutA [Betaproteobacteria bacterium]
MTTKIGALVVITTVPDENLGVKIAESLLQQRLAACVHMMPCGSSLYRWQGAIVRADEITMLIKTTTARYPEVETAIKNLHTYDVPEIVALPATATLAAYFDWILSETKQ